MSKTAFNAVNSTHVGFARSSLIPASYGLMVKLLGAPPPGQCKLSVCQHGRHLHKVGEPVIALERCIECGDDPGKMAVRSICAGTSCDFTSKDTCHCQVFYNLGLARQLQSILCMDGFAELHKREQGNGALLGTACAP